MKLTADTITIEQIHELLVELTHLPNPRSSRAIHDTKSAANALGYTAIVEGVDCRMPHGMEAEFVRRARARCAEILNARGAAS